jgi:uncharacterized protein YndB with AHSA1/START domain
MARKNIFSQKITVEQPMDWVWEVLTDPFYFAIWFGGTPVTDWAVGSPLVLKISAKMPQWDNHGFVLGFQAHKLLSFSLHNPMTMLPDTPEHREEVTLQLQPVGKKVHIQVDVTIGEVNETVEQMIQTNWRRCLPSLKKTINDAYLKAQKLTSKTN